MNLSRNPHIGTSLWGDDGFGNVLFQECLWCHRVIFSANQGHEFIWPQWEALTEPVTSHPAVRLPGEAACLWYGKGTTTRAVAAWRLCPPFPMIGEFKCQQWHEHSACLDTETTSTPNIKKIQTPPLPNYTEKNSTIRRNIERGSMENKVLMSRKRRESPLTPP